MMEDSLLNRVFPAVEFGSDILRDPQDLAIFDEGSCGAVSDGPNGLVIFALPSGKLLQHIRSCSDASSVCFDRLKNRIVVSVAKTVSQGDSTPGELHFFVLKDATWELEEVLQMPTEPKIRHGYIRWVCCDQNTGNFFVAAGDNTVAAVWKLNSESKIWKQVLERSGSLEHPSVLPKRPNDNNTSLIVVSWTETDNWTVVKMTLDPEDKLVNEMSIVRGSSAMPEPWAAHAEPDTGDVAVYDQTTGHIFTLTSPYIAPLLVGSVGIGQWLSVNIFNKWIYVACNSDRCIVGYRPQSKK